MKNCHVKALACCLLIALCAGCGTAAPEPMAEPTQEVVAATPEPTAEPEPTPEPTPAGLSEAAIEAAMTELFAEMAAFNWKGKATDYIAEHPDFVSQGGDITSTWDAMIRYDIEIEGETFSAGDKVLVHQIEGATAIVVRGI